MKRYYLCDEAGMQFGLWHSLPSIGQRLDTNHGAMVVTERQSTPDGGWYIYCSPVK